MSHSDKRGGFPRLRPLPLIALRLRRRNPAPPAATIHRLRGAAQLGILVIMWDEATGWNFTATGHPLEP